MPGCHVKPVTPHLNQVLSLLNHIELSMSGISSITKYLNSVAFHPYLAQPAQSWLAQGSLYSKASLNSPSNKSSCYFAHSFYITLILLYPLRSNYTAKLLAIYPSHLPPSRPTPYQLHT